MRKRIFSATLFVFMVLVFSAVQSHAGSEMFPTYVNAGDIHQEKGNLDKALMYYQKALPLAGAENRGAVLYRIGQVFEKKQDGLKAADYYEQAAAAYKGYKDTFWEPYLLRRAGDLHAKAQNLDKAIALYTAALASARASSRTEDEVKILNRLGDAYKAKNDMDTALKYYEQAISLTSGS